MTIDTYYAEITGTLKSNMFTLMALDLMPIDMAKRTYVALMGIDVTHRRDWNKPILKELKKYIDKKQNK